MDDTAPARPKGVPWLEGALMRYLAAGSVLDIKAPDDPDEGPVVPGATVAILTRKERPPASALLASAPSASALVASVPLASAYDAVFSRGALSHAEHPIAALAAWFALVRPGGHLVLTVPWRDPAGIDAGVARKAAIGSAPGDRSGDAPVYEPEGEPGDATGNSGREAPAPGPRPRGQAPFPSREASFQSREASFPPKEASFPSKAASFPSEEALMRTVEAALPAGDFRVVRLDTAPPDAAAPVPRPGELRLVLRKRVAGDAQPAPRAPECATTPARAEAIIPFDRAKPEAPEAPGMTPVEPDAEGLLLVRDFAPRPARVRSILVLKLDHHGDFIIGLPALRELREAFADAYIRLVCGPWNVASARACGLVDDVRPFDFFPERAVDWTGTARTANWEPFAAAAEGRFDLAIDLRVDEDTRALLGRVDAETRCGIGSQARFPMLDIALPDASREFVQSSPRASDAAQATGTQTIKADAFESRMDVKTPFHHESGFRTGDHLLLRSHDIVLPPGRYSAEFELSVRRFLPGVGGVGVHIEVIANGERKIATRSFGRRGINGLNAQRASLAFESSGEDSFYDFRVHTSGRPLSGRLRFAGLRLVRLDTRAPRFRPSELHVGEKLLLLVSLIRQRALSLVPSSAGPPRQREGQLRLVIAPFSNSTVRDWPADQYAALMTLLARRFDCRITVIGSPAQAAQARTLLAPLDAATRERVTDLVGRTQWSDMPDILRAADLVICNNSGIAHQSAALGARTLAIYSASHQPLEWGPRGPRSRAIMMAMPCSPCGWERVEDCTNDHQCMKRITPRAVLDQVVRLIGDDGI